MRISSFSFVAILATALLAGCPADDTSSAAPDDVSSTTGSTGAVSPTSAAESAGAAASSGVTEPSADTSTSGAAETDSDPGAARCPDYAALPLEELLVATPGDAVVADSIRPVVDVEFGDVGGTLSIIAVLGEDTFIVLPLDASSERPAGTALFIDGEASYQGRAVVEYQEATDTVVL